MTLVCSFCISCNHRPQQLAMKSEWTWSSGNPGGYRRPQMSSAAASIRGGTLTLLQPEASMDKSTVLSLGNIRQSLIRQEDTIIFSIIERAQFAYNAPVYETDGVPVPSFSPEGRRRSPLEYLLRETEQIHGKMRRYTSPDEHAFYPDDLPALVLPPMMYPSVLAPWSKEINYNQQVMQMYLDHLLPGITASGDDNNYGSSATIDVLCLQALSKRVHYGKFVAEAKFLAQRKEYSELIRHRDSDAIMELLTDRAVEKQVVARVRRKAATFGQDYTADGPATDINGGQTNFKVDPDHVAELFESWVMPLTKDVEVDYLLRRLTWDE